MCVRTGSTSVCSKANASSLDANEFKDPFLVRDACYSLSCWLAARFNRRPTELLAEALPLAHGVLIT
eukprot:COSAG01_NODE_513_length_16049_cov_57.758056_10_plen_67_part_00